MACCVLCVLFCFVLFVACWWYGVASVCACCPPVPFHHHSLPPHALRSAVVTTIVSKPVLASLLREEEVASLRQFCASSCPVCDRLVPFAPRTSRLHTSGFLDCVVAHMHTDHGFPHADTALTPPDKLSPALLANVTQAMNRAAPALMPSPAFAATREAVRRRIAGILSALPRPVLLRMFGSTVNGFGSDASDLDLCMFPGSEEEGENGATKTAAGWDAADMVRLAGELLEEAGFQDVRAVGGVFCFVLLCCFVVFFFVFACWQVACGGSWHTVGVSVRA